MVDVVGVVENEYVQNAGGEDIPGAGQQSLADRYQFTGRELDHESGLMHYRNRGYVPSTGRFLQKDPLGMPDGPNRYAYVRNNPVNQIDPWGLREQKEKIPVYKIYEYKVKIKGEEHKVPIVFRNGKLYKVIDMDRKHPGNKELVDARLEDELTAAEKEAGVGPNVTLIDNTQEGANILKDISVGFQKYLRHNPRDAVVLDAFLRVWGGRRLDDYKEIQLRIMQGEKIEDIIVEELQKSVFGFLLVAGFSGALRFSRAGHPIAREIEKAERHAGFKKQLTEMKPASLRKTQASLGKQIQVHREKISNAPDSPHRVHWEKEIRTFEEQLELVKQEIRRRTEQ